MAKNNQNDTMEKLVSLCKRRGYIFQSSEIYGGLTSCWDYGPLGSELKRNLKNYWWDSMTNRRSDIEGLDAAILMHPEVWRTSGHVEEFKIRWLTVAPAKHASAPTSSIRRNAPTNRRRARSSTNAT